MTDGTPGDGDHHAEVQKLERCPTCGAPVVTIFDHLDRDCENGEARAQPTEAQKSIDAGPSEMHITAEGWRKILQSAGLSEHYVDALLVQLRNGAEARLALTILKINSAGIEPATVPR